MQKIVQDYYRCCKKTHAFRGHNSNSAHWDAQTDYDRAVRGLMFVENCVTDLLYCPCLEM